ncbi:thiamine phosphate synthase [Starkeya koreensis]|uniref:Thiamine phosphate synthase n=1 Tax=Ancylobacter koreensis TaxID=266121 RepID=A0ABT0DLE5_9HYPH|nr:thiamine phosphate synthase [Ancylobacter koreensis]MCK0208098.1 thiamine phosphate synthase [Ancylobacter koreensis]
MARTPARPAPEPERAAPRLYLLLPPAGTPEEVAAQAEALTAAGRALDIAAVLVRPGAAAALQPIVAATHAIGAACLVENNVALAESVGADGAHLDGPTALKGALPALRPHGIAGAGALRSKHDAMTAAETGADYVMFGEPDAGGRRPPFEATLERTEWWAQLFEPPCVAYARALEEVDALAEAGADFIAVDGLVLDSPVEGAQALAARLAALGAD